MRKSQVAVSVLSLGCALFAMIAAQPGGTSPSHAATSPRYYEVHVFDYPGEGEAVGINPQGDVVVSGDEGGNYTHSAVYIGNSGYRLSGLVETPNTCPSTGATGINGSRQISGWQDPTCTAGEDFYSFRYDFLSGLTDYFTGPNSADAVATAINGSGQVVGSYYTSTAWPQTTRAFLWDGSFKRLPTLGGTNAEAHGTYKAGQAVGCADTPSGASHPFLYQSGVIVDLGVPTGFSRGCANSVNKNTVVAGEACAGDACRAWTKPIGGPFRLLPLPSGATTMTANHITDPGQVVGWYETSSREFGYSFQEGQLRVLNATATPFDRTIPILRAIRANLRGQIVGRGDTGDGWGDPVLLNPISVFDETATAITYGGTWTREPSSRAFGGYVKSSAARGATVTFRFSGRTVALIGPMGAFFGSAVLRADGGSPTILDEYAPAASARNRIAYLSFSSTGTHTIRVTTNGDGKFAVDAVYVSQFPILAKDLSQ
jgi:probable HAF family extracellular repeat protein